MFFFRGPRVTQKVSNYMRTLSKQLFPPFHIKKSSEIESEIDKIVLLYCYNNRVSDNIFIIDLNTYIPVNRVRIPAVTCGHSNVYIVIKINAFCIRPLV